MIGGWVRIEVKVIARAKREEVEKISENNYRIKVSSPPEKGKANERVIELLSEEFDVKKKNIKIISGETNNRKIIEIDL
jgi:hypothetical protein